MLRRRSLAQLRRLLRIVLLSNAGAGGAALQVLPSGLVWPSSGL
jgi:hypothetical protein